MNLGDVWRRPGGALVLVISADSFNAIGGHVFGCPIVRHRAPEGVGAYAVATAEVDPVSGTVLLPELDRYEPGELSAPVGILAGATMVRVAEGLRALFDL